MQDAKQLTINAIRMLSVDAIEKANSGHPGMVLGSAPIGYSIFTNMNINPKNPDFYNRDRFVLSAGHASMLLYSLHHLFGYNLPLDDIKNFRQLGSKATGHPEWKLCPGVETSTGPLGQGIANAVGMAIAESKLASDFNKEGFPIVDHYTIALCGDGCMQEGIENEAASLAGTLKLGKLIVIYDKNDVTIEGNINTSFSEDVGKRHEALGWQVIKVKDANDVLSVTRAIKKAKAEKNKPSLIIVNSFIGYGSPLQNSANCHGAPLGAENVKKLREFLNWDYAPFEIPEEVYAHCKKFARRGAKTERNWKALFKAYSEQYPELAKEFISRMNNELPDLDNMEDLWKFDKDDAGRGYSSTVLNKLALVMPSLFGGSADLGPSNKSIMKNREYYSAENRSGSNIHFGIREHAMSAICNGLYLHGGFQPYCATFTVFADYMKNGMRMSSIMNIPIVYLLTHDSIGVGEDGPTHEPIEQLTMLRAMPNMKVYRPCDGRETTAAWISVLKCPAPATLFLSRQTIPMTEGTGKDAMKGGYILRDCTDTPEIILMATGSEIPLVISAYDKLTEMGRKVRVVSMPCMEDFDNQTDAYKESVLPSNVTTRLAVEAGATTCWYKYVGLNGKVIGIDTYGASAPAKVLFKHFGFSEENVLNTALSMLK